MSESFSPYSRDSEHENVNGRTAHPGEWERRQHPCLPQVEVSMCTMAQRDAMPVLSSKGQSLQQEAVMHRDLRGGHTHIHHACCTSHRKDSGEGTWQEPSLPKEGSRRVDEKLGWVRH